MDNLGGRFLKPRSESREKQLMRSFRTLSIGVGLLGVVAVVSLVVTGTVRRVSSQSSTQAAAKSQPAQSKMVGVFIESVARQIDINDLRRVYPGTNEARISLEALKADTIVEWYDKEQSFHEQKMENHVGKEFDVGGTRILPSVLKGRSVQ